MVRLSLIDVVDKLLAYFVQHGTPINYEIIQNPEYVDDYTTTLNSLGASSWILVQTRNGYSVFKKIAIQ